MDRWVCALAGLLSNDVKTSPTTIPKGGIAHGSNIVIEPVLLLGSDRLWETFCDGRWHLSSAPLLRCFDASPAEAAVGATNVCGQCISRRFQPMTVAAGGTGLNFYGQLACGASTL
jgi:hypothetical protein